MKHLPPIPPAHPAFCLARTAALGENRCGHSRPLASSSRASSIHHECESCCGQSISTAGRLEYRGRQFKICNHRHVLEQLSVLHLKHVVGNLLKTPQFISLGACYRQISTWSRVQKKHSLITCPANFPESNRAEAAGRRTSFVFLLTRSLNSPIARN